MSRERQPELYISIDVESDGPVPGLNSMLALGAAAFDPAYSDHDPLATWYSALHRLPFPAWQNAETMRWWQTQENAWAEVNRSQQDPAVATHSFVRWLEGLAESHKLVAVGWPAAFDFAYVNYYCRHFEHRNPLGFACLDIRSYADGLASYSSYYGLSEALVREMAGEVDKTGLRAHVAIDDAIEQGRLLMLLRRYAERRKNAELHDDPAYLRLTGQARLESDE